MSEEPQIRRLRPHQLGWLRRPGLDTLTLDIWELPDGRLLAAPKGEEPILEKMSPWRPHAADR